ncbi:MAG TPA: hypothetical protein VF270_11615 [Ignavibacteriaceae bacterium]|jgi:hypothetical protein
MFTSISWQAYLIVLLGITTIYYLSVLLWFYGKDLFAFINGKQISSTEDSENHSSDSIMGAAKENESFNAVNADELHFTENEEFSESIHPLTQTTDED